MTSTLHAGDCRILMATLPAESVQCVVTSPPYFGLRDYGTASWDGGDPACDHGIARFERRQAERQPTLDGGMPGSLRDKPVTACKCGARRIDTQIGLEPSPQAYVDELVAVFREVRRVLRQDGTLWLNIGDSYAGSWGNQGRKETRGTQRPINGGMLTPVLDGRYPSNGSNTGKIAEGSGLKPKDLMMIPARVALALQADGWWIRSGITWCKGNPMPESVTDRPSSATEMVWLLTKSPRYFFDQIAISEPVSGIVQQPNLPDETFIFGQDIELEDIAPVRSVAPSSPTQRNRIFKLAVELAASLFERAELQSDLCLPALDAQVREKLLQDAHSVLVRCAPIVQGASVDACRLGRADGTAENFLQQVYRSDVALADCDVLGEIRRTIVSADSPSVDRDTDASIAVDNAGEVGKNCVSLHVQECTTAGPTSQETGRRNSRNYWVINSQPSGVSTHFATMPPALAERCIKAGTSEKGQCPCCGAPWVRVVERPDFSQQPKRARAKMERSDRTSAGQAWQDWRNANPDKQLGWSPSCACPEHMPVPQTVLDPFAGAGTSLVVASRLQRHGIGIELNPAYAALTRQRLISDAPLFAEIAA